MQLIAGGAGKSAPPGAAAAGAAPPPMQGTSGAPVGAPMTTPQPNAGEQQAAMVDVSMALDLLEKSLMSFGSETGPGQAIHKALGMLSKEFGAKRDGAKQLVPAELMQLMGSLPQAGGGSPEMKAMQGGGAPGGMPPGAAPPPMQPPMAA